MVMLAVTHISQVLWEQFGINMTKEQQEAFDLINNYRVSLGLFPCAFNTALAVVASIHVKEISQAKLITDSSPVGTDYRQLAYDNGYSSLVNGVCCSIVNPLSAGKHLPHNGSVFFSLLQGSAPHESWLADRMNVQSEPGTGFHIKHMAVDNIGGFWTVVMGNGDN